jgi:lysine-N-methylase
MATPILHLPLVQESPVSQNWDCRATGTCCQEYRIRLSEEERLRIEQQGWDAARDLGGHQPFRRIGWLRPRYELNQLPGGNCVFLSAEGRCRIHERFGFEAKPLACRLFPFILVPVAGQWRVGMRFACPSAAASVGRPWAEHTASLEEFAAGIVRREGLNRREDGSLVRPPRLDAKQLLDWPDLVALTDRFLALLHDRRDPVELRWRKCLALNDLLRQTPLASLTRADRERTLSLLTSTAEDTKRDPWLVAAPEPSGRVIFRLIASLYTRKDHGPNRGLVAKGWSALLGGVLSFARGSGPVPRMHAWLPEATFEQAEEPRGPLDAAAEEVLERYYAIKVGSFQFCGAYSHGLPFLEGLEGLAVTVPLILWVMRLYRDLPRQEAAVKAIGIIDDHFGFNPLLGSTRLRWAIRILARGGDLSRLIAWYSR